MDIRIDGGSGEPVYRQIVQAIRHQVATGQLQPGDRLPPVRELAQAVRVDRNTALRAYRVLHREGVISLEHGRGTFVRADARQPQLTQHRHHTLENIMDESVARALSLGYAPDEIERAFEKRMTSWRRARKALREE